MRVFIENLVVLLPNGTCTAAHYFFGFRDQSFVSRYAVRVYHHKYGHLRPRLCSQVLGEAHSLAEKLSLLLERRIVDLFCLNLVEGVFFEVAPKISNKWFPSSIALDTAVGQRVSHLRFFFFSASLFHCLIYWLSIIGHALLLSNQILRQIARFPDNPSNTDC